MSFAFNFSGDDIDHDMAADEAGPDAQQPAATFASSTSIPVVQHDLEEWLHLLPSALSYTVTPLTSPSGKTLPMPRRELFDIRTQLMAEEADAVLASLADSDLRTNVYEGGFKTWECSLDLASLLLDRGPRKDIDELARVAHVVELGAGSAVPSAVLLQHALREKFPVGFTLADFNADVLRLVTVPNLLLAWAVCVEGLGEEDGSGWLEVTSEVVQGFLAALKAAGVTIRLVSGPWGEALAKALPESVPDITTLVLAAETIYSPQSLESFTDLLATILKSGRMHKGMVAAKKFYFGVGGSTDAFKIACRDRGLIAAEVENSGLQGIDAGVGRAVIEVQTL